MAKKNPAEVTGIGDLFPDPRNARKHSPRNVGSITDALHKVGAARSIVIDEDNVILAGNATVEAAGHIADFYRFNQNLKVRVSNGKVFKAAEDFTDRYDNVPMSGFNYFMFAKRKEKNRNPFTLNTRVYSCILLSNRVTFRWRGRYNEDTDLSIRILKAGYCTILFNAFLAEKMPTMTMKGGNSDELYEQNDRFDGRLEMAKSLFNQHPDVVKITRKWGRWQHQVDYRLFKNNRLRRRPDAVIPKEPNEYGMRLVHIA